MSYNPTLFGKQQSAAENQSAVSDTTVLAAMKALHQELAQQLVEQVAAQGKYAAALEKNGFSPNSDSGSSMAAPAA